MIVILWWSAFVLGLLLGALAAIWFQEGRELAGGESMKDVDVRLFKVTPKRFDMRVIERKWLGWLYGPLPIVDESLIDALRGHQLDLLHTRKRYTFRGRNVKVLECYDSNKNGDRCRWRVKAFLLTEKQIAQLESEEGVSNS